MTLAIFEGMISGWTNPFQLLTNPLVEFQTKQCPQLLLPPLLPVLVPEEILKVLLPPFLKWILFNLEKCSQHYGKQLVTGMPYWKLHPKHHKVANCIQNTTRWLKTFNMSALTTSPHHPNYHFLLLTGNFINAATLPNPKDYDPITSPAPLLALQTTPIQKWHWASWTTVCDKFMPKSDETMWNSDWLAWRFGVMFLWEFCDL